ncbi:MAG: DNA polymerase, partial [Oscillospiraceae bacterium]|nr:DNA polymerase [Oscillospiraceae bacterium]
MAIKTLSIDLETYSDVDLKKCGVYKYAESPNFEILLFGVSVDGGDVIVYDLVSGDTIPEEILKALSDDSVTKWAYNASFERICLSVWLRRNHPQYFSSYSIDEDTVGNYLDPCAWRCSLVWGAYMGLPLSLEGIGAVLKLGNQKMTEGKALIRYFCVPCKPTKANGGRTRNLPEHDPIKWSTFIAYNKRDVEVEMAIQQKLSKFPVPDFLWDEYHLDQEINDRGIQLDMVLVNQAIAIDERSREELSAKMKELTSLENPNSVQQMKEWLTAHGLEVDSLDKKAVKELLKTAPPKLAEVLELRRQLAKSSVKKYQAMQNAVCADGRARGMFQFYGANRSGRWAGRLIQLQNLPQNHMAHLEDARNLVRSGDYSMLSILYDSVPEVLSELIRTAFVPKEGYKFIVADFSAIEARVLSFLADESWRIKVFENNGDIYCASASAMFHV